MKYFIDTEFIERFHKPLFGKARHVIDLISIGIVAEDGREYSAISNEYRYKDADDWVKENVIMPLYTSTVHNENRNMMSVQDFHWGYGKSNKQIAKEIVEFVTPPYKFDIKHPINYSMFKHMEAHRITLDKTCMENIYQPDFYGYFADYDWVLFCSLFGRMIDLPKGFPMYCRDLKQMFDEKQGALIAELGDIETVRLKEYDSYPKQTGEHLAIADARWNKQLYDFIKSI